MLSLENNEIKHNVSTNSGSSGSPIIRRCNDNYIIGLHSGAQKKDSYYYEFNLATPFNLIINDINNKISFHNNNIQNTNIFYNNNNQKNNNIINYNEYNNKINYKYKKEPQNLKFKFDITNTNTPVGWNDMFEVIICYKDNKEYIILLIIFIII